MYIYIYIPLRKRKSGHIRIINFIYIYIYTYYNSVGCHNLTSWVCSRPNVVSFVECSKSVIHIIISKYILVFIYI